VFEAASVQFKADESALHGILSNTPQPVGIDSCHSCLDFFHEIFESPGRDCVNEVLRASPRGKDPSELDPAIEEGI
jgi:hypothetical protein